MVRKINVNGLSKAIGTNSVVMYYAPWCGYCTSMKPTFDEVGEKAAAAAAGVHVVRFNMDKHGSEVMQKQIGKTQFGVSVGDDVKGFPTVVMYKADGTRSLYKGPRSTEAMVETIKAYYA